MGDATKSLAAEIEAVIRDPVAVHLNMLRGTIARPSIENIIHLYGRDALLAALQSRAFEDGARWMRDRAATECVGRTTFGVEEWDAGYDSACELCAEEIQALPLQPEEAQPTPTTEDKGREDRA